MPLLNVLFVLLSLGLSFGAQAECPNLEGIYNSCQAFIVDQNGNEGPFGGTLPQSIEIKQLDNEYHLTNNLVDEEGPYQDIYSIYPDRQRRLEDQLAIRIYRHSYCETTVRGPELTTIAIERDKDNRYTVLGHKTGIVKENPKTITFLEYTDILGTEASEARVEQSKEILFLVRCTLN